MAVALCLSSVTLRTEPMPAASDREADGLAVYAALLSHPSLTGPGGKQVVVVKRELVSAEFRVDASGWEQNFRRSLHKAAPSTIDAFLAASRQEGELPAALGQTPGVTLVASAELARVLEAPGRDYWSTFARRYPKARGIVSLSAIAYGESGNEAMAYLGFNCGLLCGHGLVVVLQRDGTRWVPVEHLYLWES
jgi:hypothetical protein